MFKRLGLFLLSVLFIQGCVYGPRAERKTPMSYLAGDSYETSVGSESGQLVLPIMKRKDKPTQIEGKIMTGQGIARAPLKNMQIGLYSMNGKLIQSVTSEGGGEFLIRGSIENGKYLLKVISDTYAGGLPIEVNSYSVNDVIVSAQKNKL